MLDFLIETDAVDDELAQRLQQSFVLAYRELEEIDDERVEVVITGDDHIRELNRNHRDLDEATDVLSFPTQTDGAHVPPEVRENMPFGSVVISWDRVVEQARENKNKPIDEAILLFIHGLLHLLGYDHDESESAKRMEERTRKLARKLEISEIEFGH